MRVSVKFSLVLEQPMLFCNLAFMKTYIVLLRGINVGGHKKIRMSDLKVLFESLNFHSVKTYIQSGNIVFKSEDFSTDQLKIIIEKKIESNYSFHVIAFVFEFTNFIDLSNSKITVPNTLNHKSLYFIFLSKNPDIELVENITSFNNENEQFWTKENVIYLNGTRGYANGKMSTNFFERKLKLDATARNWRTITNLIEIAKEIA